MSNEQLFLLITKKIGITIHDSRFTIHDCRLTPPPSPIISSNLQKWILGAFPADGGGLHVSGVDLYGIREGHQFGLYAVEQRGGVAARQVGAAYGVVEQDR